MPGGHPGCAKSADSVRSLGDERQRRERVRELVDASGAGIPELVERRCQGLARDRVEVRPSIHRRAQPGRLELPCPPSRGELRAATGCHALAGLLEWRE